MALALIDFHCHLDLYPNPSAVAARCAALGMYVLSVTTVPSAFEGTAALAPRGARIRTALGLHPELAATRSSELGLFERILPRSRYVGEVGLDGSRDHRATLDLQRAVFTEVLRLCAQAGGRVLSIHSRGMAGAVLDAIEAEPAAGIPVMHWFGGNSRQIARAAELGCWFSIGPAMLASARGIAVAKLIPPDRLLPESDGPFAKLEDRPAYPWDAWAIVPQLAALWGDSPGGVALRLQANLKFLVESTPLAPIG